MDEMVNLSRLDERAARARRRCTRRQQLRDQRGAEPKKKAKKKGSCDLFRCIIVI